MRGLPYTISLYLLAPHASRVAAVTHKASAAIMPTPTYNIQCTFFCSPLCAGNGEEAGWNVVLRRERACTGPVDGVYTCAVRRGGTGICWRVVSIETSRLSIPRRPVVGVFQRIELVCGRGGFEARGSSSASSSSSIHCSFCLLRVGGRMSGESLLFASLVFF